MFKTIRESKVTKITTYYLAIMLFLQMVQPMQLYALTEGPSQPEFNSFTPIGTSDMVDLASGDFNYNIPIMDVGGYPINLAYNSGVTMDQESSWVGLGWNLNVGQINRNIRGLPDDFKGDIVATENNLKTNVTVGASAYVNAQIIGALDGPALSLGAGLDVQYNNYTGLSAVPSFGPSFKFTDYVSVGMQLSSSVESGASFTPSVSISAKKMKSTETGDQFTASITPSITYNSRQGLQSFNLASSVGFLSQFNKTTQKADGTAITSIHKSSGNSTGSGSISFLNNTFTPSKRLAFKNNNVRFSFSGGPDIWGVHAEISIAGYASVQSLVSKNVLQKSYGYENTHYATDADLMDFNREKEQSAVSQNTLVLPVTNYTYDICTIQGQELSGMFRPFRGQVGNVSEARVTDRSASNSFGFEIEAGAGGHKGLNFRTTSTTSYTGGWNTIANPFFKEKRKVSNPLYEKVYFKMIGETTADDYNNTTLTNLGKSNPITLQLDDNKNAINAYRTKMQVGLESQLGNGSIFSSQIKREDREQRNKVIQKLTNEEVKRFALSPSFITYDNTISEGVPTIPSHHTAAYLVTAENGSRHVYGEPAYNRMKKEVSFSVSLSNTNLDKGTITYQPTDNTTSNSQGRDHYFNNIVTPVYAHTYLLSSVLSADYSDITANGPTDDDLGSYTKFKYDTKANYHWRIPYNEMEASYNEGLKTDNLDQKGSYLYGVKDNKYLKVIETKTHVAFIDIEARKDGHGVIGEMGGRSTATNNTMYRIKTIRLYSKPEILVYNVVVDPGVVSLIKPIKTAHFEYDYSLCPNVENNSRAPENGQVDGSESNLNENAGKLTLRRVYFTYKGSNMGKYTPYRFNYKLGAANPSYHVKGYDIWGNYKKFEQASHLITSPATTPQEFPYVNQSDRTQQDIYAAAWSLSSVTLPSGGKINVEYEADDYQYVQDKKAMQMFKVDGVTNDWTTYSSGNSAAKMLYNSNSEANYIAIKIPPSNQSVADIIKSYTDGLVGKPIYFNFLLNMTGSKYDYVSGYFEMDSEAHLDNNFLFIKMKLINREGRLNSTDLTNPISVAGWFFGRQNLNSQIYGVPDPGGSVPSNVVDIGRSILNNIELMAEFFTGANGYLRDNNCAKTFKPAKSWIRLLEPTGSKIGGGARVKTVVLLDEWDKMLDMSDSSLDIDRYAKQYGQKYEYDLNDKYGTSSGVATYEPNICKENPLIMPFYSKPEKLTTQSYQEKPFGESFYPAPTVTYSRVTVSNLTANINVPSRSGKVVTEHFTTYDFPTISDFTNLDKSKIFQSNENEAIGNMLKSLLGLKITVKTDLTMSQGFIVETNDMNGKLKKQEVYNDVNALISGVQYVYNTDANDERILENKLPTIDENGIISEKQLSTNFDVINDLRESYSYTNSQGVAVNLDYIPLGPFPIFIGWGKPERSEHTQILHTAVTTKIVHKSGILKEKIAYDLGSTVYTKNHAWDAMTGQVLLTETVNEYDDKYFSFNYPAYWHYKDMGMASQNTDFAGVFNWVNAETGQNGEKYFKVFGMTGNISSYLRPGDELGIKQSQYKRLWVYGYNDDQTAVRLMDANGNKIDNFNIIRGNIPRFRIMRPAARNLQTASMASITLMRNPLINVQGHPNDNIGESFLMTSTFNPKVINASAIEYNEYWDSQCENGLPQPGQTEINQYLFNIKGQWRPVKSFAFLTGRNSSASSYTRNTGYFSSFNPFYELDTITKKWNINNLHWTFASQITKFNPYGAELENRDALGRYSSAQYGYQYKLPVAVASNSKYSEMGVDNFEDYASSTSPSSFKPHFGFNEYIGENFISELTSHTGKKSIKIKPASKITLKKKLQACEP